MASQELIRLIAELAEQVPAGTLEEVRRAWDETCTSLEPVDGVLVDRVDAGGLPLLAITPAERGTLEVLYCHGGAFALGSGWHHRGMLSQWAAEAGVKIWAVDYRLAPESPFPAALDDADAAYRWLSEQAKGPMIVAGDSCGANLALGATIRARDRGETLPAAIVCLSPWVDLTLSGDSLIDNARTDPFISRADLAECAASYLGATPPRDPGASPLFADLRGLPPTLIQVGAQEALLSDSFALCRAAAAAGVSVTLEAIPDVVHIWQLWAGEIPESSLAVTRLADFCGRSGL